MATYRMKKGYGKHWQGGRCYKPGDVIECLEQELGGAKDKFELVGNPDVPPAARKTLVLETLPRGWFNVRNGETGEKINTKALRESEARELLGMSTTGMPDTGEQEPEAEI